MKKFLLVASAVIFSSALNAEDQKSTNSTNQPAPTPVVQVYLNTDFVNVDQFVQSLKAFDPSKVKNGIADLFSALQIGQPEENDTDTRIYPDKIQSVEVLFQNDKKAVFFAVAKPDTDATPSCVGVLFSLSSDNGLKKWRICDTKRFYTSGKYAGVFSQVSSDVGTGYNPELNLVISVEVTEGGRGESSSTSGSFRVGGWGQFSQISLN